MLLFFPVNCFNLFERLNIFFLPKNVNSTELHIYSYAVCMQIHSIQYWRVTQGTQRERTVYQFKGRLPNSFKVANQILQAFFIPPQRVSFQGSLSQFGLKVLH